MTRTKRNKSVPKKEEKILGREDFISFRIELIDVPELGGKLYIRDMGGASLLKYMEKIQEFQKTNPEINVYNSLELMSLLISLTACDSEGNLIFSESDIKQLANGKMLVLVGLSEKIMNFLGFGSNVINEVKKNLKNAQFDSFITD